MRLTMVVVAGSLCALLLTAHADAQTWGPETRVSNTGGYSGGSVGRALAVDGAGRLHVLWTEVTGSQRDVYYARSVDDGQTWTTPIDLSASPLPAGGGNLAVGPDDVIHAAWTDRRAGNQRVYYARSFNAGSSWESPRDISGAQELSVATPSITVDLENRVHVAWHIGDPDLETPAAQVFYTRSTNGGTGFETPRRLSAVTGQHAAWPRFSVDRTRGDVVAIAWRDRRRNPDWDLGIAVSTTGGGSFTEQTPALALRQWDPDVIVDAQGIIHLAYMTYRTGGITIDYRRSTDRGQTWTPEITLSTTVARFPFWMRDAQRNVLWLLWKDETGGAADLAIRSSADAGSTWSGVEAVTALGDIEVKFPSPAIGPDGRPHVIWSDARYGEALETVFHTARGAASGPAPTALPGAPQGLSAQVVGRRVTLSWSAPASGGAITQYVLAAGLSPGATDYAAAVGAVTRLDVPGVAPGIYYARVRAANSAGTGPPSNEITVVVR